MRATTTIGARLRLLALAAALLLAATGCVPGAAGNPNLAAVVGGREIPLAALEDRFATVSQNPQVEGQLRFDEDGSFRSQLQAQVLTQLIRSALLERGARELGVTVTDADVAATRAEIVEEVGGPEAFELLIEQNNLTEEEVEEQLRDLAIQERLEARLTEDLEISDEELRALYESERERRFERASARHIMVETEEEAQAALERLQAGEDFADLAQELSIDEGSADLGGDLGEFSRGRYPEQFEDAVFAAETGAVLGPLPVGDTWHVAEVTSVTFVPFAQAAEELREELLASRRAEALTEWQQRNAQAADVRVNPRFGRWDATNAQVVVADPLGDTRAPTPQELPLDLGEGVEPAQPGQ